MTIPHPSIYDTIELAARLHRNQRDQAGVPYIAHPLEESTEQHFARERRYRTARLRLAGIVDSE